MKETLDKNEKTGKFRCSWTLDTEACTRPVCAKGLCKKHHLRKWNQENCVRIRAKKRAIYAAQRDHILALRRKRNYETLARGLWRNARKRALQRGLLFSLNSRDIIIPTHCPILGIALATEPTMKNRETAPSLDRIIPEFGYVKGNIQVISYRANRIKNDATCEEIEKLHTWMLKQKSLIQ